MTAGAGEMPGDDAFEYRPPPKQTGPLPSSPALIASSSGDLPVEQPHQEPDPSGDAAQRDDAE